MGLVPRLERIATGLNFLVTRAAKGLTALPIHLASVPDSE